MRSDKLLLAFVASDGEETLSGVLNAVGIKINSTCCLRTDTVFLNWYLYKTYINSTYWKSPL